MGKYTGIPCAACGRLFEEGDDIVVCPVCGAPHHRECYEKLGHCALEERHALGEAWQPPKGKQGDNPALVICNTWQMSPSASTAGNGWTCRPGRSSHPLGGAITSPGWGPSTKMPPLAMRLWRN